MLWLLAWGRQRVMTRLESPWAATGTCLRGGAGAEQTCRSFYPPLTSAGSDHDLLGVTPDLGKKVSFCFLQRRCVMTHSTCWRILTSKHSEVTWPHLVPKDWIIESPLKRSLTPKPCLHSEGSPQTQTRGSDKEKAPVFGGEFEKTGEELRAAPRVEVSDLCRWSLSVVSGVTESTHSGAESHHLGANAACLPNNRLRPTWCCAEERWFGTLRGTPRLIPGVAWTPFFCSATKNPRYGCYKRTWPGLVSASTDPEKTQPLLHRRVVIGISTKAFQIRSCYKTSSHARLLSGPVADRRHFEDGSKWNKLFLKRGSTQNLAAKRFERDRAALQLINLFAFQVIVPWIYNYRAHFRI